MSIRTRDRPRLVALLALVLAGSGACTNGERAASTVTVLDPNFEAIFNPSWDMPAKFMLFLPLVGLSERGAIEPRLAQRWEHSADRRTWTYHLRTDVRWHDGVPVTARDVAWSMELMSRPEISYFPGLDSALVPDDSTVTVHMRRPHEGDDWWTVFYPKHLLDTLDPAKFFEWDFWLHPVGDGPFRFVRYEPKTVWEMAANPDYYRGKPKVERLLIKFGGGSPVIELESGQVDAVSYLSRADIPRLQADPRFRVYYNLYPNAGWVEGIYWNHRSPLFRDRQVRRALTLAIDRVELRQVLNLPDSLPMFDVLFSGRQFWTGKIIAALPYDTAAARRLFAEAGWRDSDGDGVLDRDGRPLRFTLLVEMGGSSATGAWGRAAVYIQAAYRAVGVDMQVQTLQTGVIPRIRAHDYDAALNRFFQPDARRVFADELGYGDPALLARIQAAVTELDTARADRLLADLAPIIGRDIPITFIAPNLQYSAARARVHGLSSPFRAYPLADAEYLWVERP